MLPNEHQERRDSGESTWNGEMIPLRSVDIGAVSTRTLSRVRTGTAVTLLSAAGVAVIYGIVLWIFALYIMASLIAGQPAFLGFTGITWVALAGHVLFAIIAAMVVRWRDGQARGMAM